MSEINWMNFFFFLIIEKEKKYLPALQRGPIGEAE
jgi:hypothetical protein